MVDGLLTVNKLMENLLEETLKNNDLKNYFEFQRAKHHFEDLILKQDFQNSNFKKLRSILTKSHSIFLIEKFMLLESYWPKLLRLLKKIELEEKYSHLIKKTRNFIILIELISDILPKLKKLNQRQSRTVYFGRFSKFIKLFEKEKHLLLDLVEELLHIGLEEKIINSLRALENEHETLSSIAKTELLLTSFVVLSLFVLFKVDSESAKIVYSFALVISGSGFVFNSIGLVESLMNYFKSKGGLQTYFVEQVKHIIFH